MSDAGTTELDHRGAYANPRYINDLQPTTRFHPSELPADPEAIRRFPKNLIDENHYTESPLGDASLESRKARATQSWVEAAARHGVDKILEALGMHSPKAADAAAELAPAASTEEEPESPGEDAGEGGEGTEGENPPEGTPEDDSGAPGADQGAGAPAGDGGPEAAPEGAPGGDAPADQGVTGEAGTAEGENPTGDAPPAQ